MQTVVDCCFAQVGLYLDHRAQLRLLTGHFDRTTRGEAVGLRTGLGVESRFNFAHFREDSRVWCLL